MSMLLYLNMDRFRGADRCNAPGIAVVLRFREVVAGWCRDGSAGEAAATKTRSSYDRVASTGGFAPGRTEARTVGGLKDGLAFRPASPQKRRVRFAPS